ncbi:MAG: efflux RND transporter periplasmic adaptor subunit [Planctomycetota bacterium]
MSVRIGAAGLVLAAVGLGAWMTRQWWAPPVVRALASTLADDAEGGMAGASLNEASEVGHDREAGAGEAAHQHEAAATTEIRLSDTAQRNVGLTLAAVETRAFERTVSIPAVVTDRPGRSQIVVSAPMTGVVTRIYPIRGESVRPEDPLFDLRLTHEDLVQKQSELLRAVEELEVIRREVARLEEVTASGAVAGKTLLDRKYEEQKLEAAVRAEKQALLLHGLNDAQIEGIVGERQLLKELTVFAPKPADCEQCTAHDDYLEVAELAVSPGQQVTAGTHLGTLSDHCELYIEGRAFEQDAAALTRAATDKAELTALVSGADSGARELSGLQILYVENEVERDSRALRFYVRLPNVVVRNETTPDGHRFIGWRYKPGQRVDLLVPVEQWKDRIVLPVDAVVQDGVEWFVYQQLGGRFVRRPVHVEHRDARWAVVANDGSLFPGDQVAVQGAYQIHLALKNQSGGGVDPHAGHNH